MLVNVYNNPHIKLQGISYYSDCYKFWDLNLCKDNFSSILYEQIINKLYNKTHQLYVSDSRLAVIDLQKYNNNFLNYYNLLPKKIIKSIESAKNKKYYLKEYNFNDHLVDFLEINQSQNLKKGHINPWYLQKIENFKGSHSSYLHHWEDEKHFSKWYGLFKYYKNYKQEEKITNEKLFAYCKVAIDGEMASIHLIWANANYLKDDIMFVMLANVIKELFSYKWINCIVYYGYEMWKSKLLFESNFIKVEL